MTSLTKKSPKVSRTIRFDAELEKQAKIFATSHHMDFTTLLHISLQNTVKDGISIRPTLSEERVVYYKKLAEEADAGVGISQPYKTKEENTQYLLSLMTK